MMNEKDMQEALLKLAFEMTSSMITGLNSIEDMNLVNEEQLFDVAQYLKHLIYKEQTK